MMSCYYPTTTIAIDDDLDFLRILSQHLGIADCIPYPFPKEAIKAIREQRPYQRIQGRILKETAPHEDLNSSPEDFAVLVNTRGLHEEIYNKERFRDVSVIIVDYHMGEISGIDVCEALSDHPAKKILLTGSVDKELVALEAFNKGIIHRFISKSDPSLPSKLKHATCALKEAYFRDLTALLFPYLESNRTNLTKAPAYVNFVKNLHDQFAAVECYVTDSNGSCVFLTANGKATWFIIKHESELENFVTLAKDQEASPDFIQSLVRHEMIPFFFSDEDYQRPANDWEIFLHKAQPLVGVKGYHYAIIEGYSSHLNHNKIATYDSYRESAKKGYGHIDQIGV